MLAKRIIPCLDVHAGRVVKGTNFLNLRDAGDPVQVAARYEQEGADELVFLDITASHEERDILLDVVRRTAEVIFMPHVTMGTPSTRPGAGFVDPGLWANREADPTSLRIEFDGLKGRGWLMKWLPARAYDNGVYVVFSNPIGMDDDQVRNGCSMVIDPFGDVIAECRSFDNEIAVASLVGDKLTQAGGHRYRNARRPELYGAILGAEHKSQQKVVWLDGGQK